MPRRVVSPHTANPESGTNAYGERPNMLDAAVTMGAIACNTTRIKLAPSVLVSPYRHPLSDARQFATVDILSGGRLIMAVGPGWCREEFDALRVPFAQRGAITAECIEIYKAAWAQSWVQFHGRFFDFPEVSVDPKPRQRPRPPIYYGGVTRAGIRRALQHCDGVYPIVTDPDVSKETFAGLRNTIEAEAEALGRDLAHFKLMTLVMCLVTEKQNVSTVKRRSFMSGSPDNIVEDLTALASCGFSHCTVHLDVRSGSIAEFIDMMELLGEEVVPSASALN